MSEAYLEEQGRPSQQAEYFISASTYPTCNVGARAICAALATNRQEEAMSSIFNGGSNIFIAPKTSQGWRFTWGNGGWQGNVINETQPLNTGANMAFSLPSVSLNNNGTYSFSWTATNSGPNSTFYNLQTSSS